MLTLFTTCKPFIGHNGVIQRNALRSWTKLDPRPEILIFGDEEGSAEAAREFGLIHIPTVERSENGAPLVRAMFNSAEAVAAHHLLAYANADILFLNDFLRAVELIKRPRFFMTGRRWNVDVEEPIDYDAPDWEKILRQKVEQTGELFSGAAMDYFVFPKGQWRDLPPLVVGRAAWDNWLLSEAKRCGHPVFDITPCAIVIHQNHDYRHVAGGKNTTYAGPDARQNQAIAHNRLFTLEDADYRLEPGGLKRVSLSVRSRQCLRNFIAFHPRLVRVMKRLLAPTLFRSHSSSSNETQCGNGVSMTREEGRRK